MHKIRKEDIIKWVHKIIDIEELVLITEFPLGEATEKIRKIGQKAFKSI